MTIEKTVTTDSPQMGPLEQAVFSAERASASKFRRRYVADSQAANSEDLDESRSQLAGHADEIAVGGFEGMRRRRRLSSASENDVEETIIDFKRPPPMPGRIAARLLLARLFDSDPTLMNRIMGDTPVVIVDVPDVGLYNRIASSWRQVLGLDRMRFLEMSKLSDETVRGEFGAISAVYGKPMMNSDRIAADARAYHAVQIALPVIAITPAAETHLSKVLLDAATDRLTLPGIDGQVVRSLIEIVTGEQCGVILAEDLVARIGVHEILLSVRYDRTAAECIARLTSIVNSKIATAGGRELSLDELFGLDDAVAWARSTAFDLRAWRRGEIGWDALDAGVILDGPPGVGKTLFAKTAAAHLGLPMISGTLSGWQGSGEGHLGSLLKAMKADFAEARSKTPCVFFVDEIDSFPDRSAVKHDHRDYIVAVVNGFIEQIDGIHGREGIIFIGATNDVGRCDPAIVRAGRFNRIIQVGLPDQVDLEKMLRVRLKDDLRTESVEEIALLALGSSGADIERVVKDARRAARHAGRSVSLADLRLAVTGADAKLSPGMLERASVHEAGHIVISVIHNGAADIQAIVGGMSGSAGFVVGRNDMESAGTLEDYRKILHGLLAGRAAEELMLGAAGHGSGGIAGTSDLASATRIAAALVGSVGHAGPHPLVFLADHRRAAELLDQFYVREAVQKELATAYRETTIMLSDNIAALQEVARLLRVEGRIDGHTVGRIIASFAGAPIMFRSPNGSAEPTV